MKSLSLNSAPSKLLSEIGRFLMVFHELEMFMIHHILSTSKVKEFLDNTQELNNEEKELLWRLKNNEIMNELIEKAIARNKSFKREDGFNTIKKEFLKINHFKEFEEDVNEIHEKRNLLIHYPKVYQKGKNFIRTREDQDTSKSAIDIDIEWIRKVINKTLKIIDIKTYENK